MNDVTYRMDMNKYQLEQVLNLLEIITDLSVRHIPETYAREIIREVVKTKDRVKKDIKNYKE